MDRFEGVTTQYRKAEEFLVRNVSENVRDEFRRFFLSCTLRIWGANSLYAPDYATALNSVFHETYSVEQILTGMYCCADTNRVLAVPSFLKGLANKDLQTGTTLCKEFLELLNQLLVSAILVNGDFTIEEANALTGVVKRLSDYCETMGISLCDTADYIHSITPRKDESYLRKTEPASPAEEKNPPAQDSANTPININLTLEVAGGDGIRAELDHTTDKEFKPSVSPAGVKPEGEPNQQTLEELLEELDSLTGLEKVKQDVRSLMNFLRISRLREQRGMKVPTISYHLVFTGNPGTGKTTIARLVAKLYYHMGLLPQGQLVETDRSALVAGYLGQTAIKTQKVIQQALGGVLFIDEAYSLAGETDDSYGREAIETILKAMEDHRDELVVIVAGYDELMHKFINSNPGLASRFNKYFHFPDYNGDELMSIFLRFCRTNGYSVDERTSEVLQQHFNVMFETREEHFGNARAVRNLFERAIHHQANRLAQFQQLSDQDLEQIKLADIEPAIQEV